MTSPTPHRFAVLLAFAAAAAAQERTGSVQGSVIDQDFQAPLADAKVTLLETGQFAITGADGTYVLAGVRPRKYTVIVAKDGYTRVPKEVVVAPGEVVDLRVELVGTFTDMEEFVVQDLQLGGGSESALLQLRLDSPSLMDSISSDLMSRAGASDAAGALRLVAGASVQDGKSAVIRGLPDRYVSSQMNGVRLPSAEEDKRAVELDQFPSAVIQSIQVSKTFTPEQQGDASGGAVDVRLKGIPDEPLLFQIKSQYGRNSQVGNRNDFLTYHGGGVSFFGKDGGGRAPQADNTDWNGAVGTSTGEAPVDSKWSMALGGRHELGDGVRIGGFASVFYERDSSFYDHGIDDSYWVKDPGERMTPRQLQVNGPEDFKTALYDVTRGSESVRWGGLTTVGVESDRHSLTLAYLFTNTAEDTATLAQDTRGKQYFFPGHDPQDPSTPGHDQSDAAPYNRQETLKYTERTTGTLQLHGTHKLDVFDDGKAPELSWSVAESTAASDQPDKRQFGEQWRPGRQVLIGNTVFTQAPLHSPLKPNANFTLGNLQRIYQTIDEKSDQYAADLKIPFAGWSDTAAEKSEGYLKLGLFHDHVRRRFNQDSFSNFSDNSDFSGPFDVPWSSVFPAETHLIGPSVFDVDYLGKQDITAWYAMAQVPVTTRIELIGGARIESTSIDIINSPESGATWLPLGSLAPTQLNPGDADVAFAQDDVLPALGLVWQLTDELTLRAAYAQTVARQTFKELTPILQQEFLGGPVFVGNPELQMSSLQNYDLRLDYVPYEGGLLSTTLFRKDIKDPIEYVQRPAAFDVTTAVNYPEGRLEGLELEARQKLDWFWPGLGGLAIGANATFLQAKVTLPADEAAGFSQPNIQAPMRERDMTNAPEHIYNAFATYEVPVAGTKLALFYTVQGDTLIAGAGQAQGNFIPSTYALQYDTLNFSLAQPLGDYVELNFGAKNLTNPDLTTVYRSAYAGGDVRKTQHSDGIDYSISIGGSIRF